MKHKKIGETTYKETAFGIIPRSKLITLEIEGIKKAWDFLVKAASNKKLAFSPLFLRKVHQVGFGWIFPETGGFFRLSEVRISNHQPPKYYLVSQMMDDFCKDIKLRMKHLVNSENEQFFQELVKLLAWAHHRFLWIHPFLDYNGRMSRLLINMILIKLDLPPVELKVETETGRIKYIKSLQNADQGNYNDLRKIIFAAIKESMLSFK